MGGIIRTWPIYLATYNLVTRKRVNVVESEQ